METRLEDNLDSKAFCRINIVPVNTRIQESNQSSINKQKILIKIRSKQFFRVFQKFKIKNQLLLYSILSQQQLKIENIFSVAETTSYIFIRSSSNFYISARHLKINCYKQVFMTFFHLQVNKYR